MFVLRIGDQDNIECNNNKNGLFSLYFLYSILNIILNRFISSFVFFSKASVLLIYLFHLFFFSSNLTLSLFLSFFLCLISNFSYLFLVCSLGDDSDDDEFMMGDEIGLHGNISTDNNINNNNNNRNSNNCDNCSHNDSELSLRYLLSTSLDVDTKYPYSSEIRGLTHTGNNNTFNDNNNNNNNNNANSNNNNSNNDNNNNNNDDNNNNNIRSSRCQLSTAKDHQTILVTSMLMGLGEGKEGKVYKRHLFISTPRVIFSAPIPFFFSYFFFLLFYFSFFIFHFLPLISIFNFFLFI